MTTAKQESIATADAHLNNVGLINYTDAIVLLSRLANFAKHYASQSAMDAGGTDLVARAFIVIGEAQN